jgi:type IV secretion system protein TrbF
MTDSLTSANDDTFGTTTIPRSPATAHQAPEPSASDNPYTSGNATWTRLFDRVLGRTAMVWCVAVLSLLVNVIQGANQIQLGAQGKCPPYIVEQCNGQIRGILPATPLDATDPETLRKVTRSHLLDFVASVRQVTPDSDLQRKWIQRALASVKPNEPGGVKTRQYLLESNPVKRAGKELVRFEGETLLEQKPGTWQMQWREVIFNRDGTHRETIPMQAILTVYRNPLPLPESEEALNPLAEFIRDWDWSRRL